jgi:uncharacterized membrane protein HdeD (DUF308 family)
MSFTPNESRLVRDLFGDLRRNWGWLLALGVVFVLLGLCGLVLTAAVTIATVLVIGIFLIGGGVLLAIQTFRARGWQSRWWQLLIALLYIAAGVLIVADPVLASFTLTLLIAAILFAAGILRLAIAWQHRGERGNGLFWLTGIFAILLGIVIAIEWPVSGLLVIGIFVSLELLFHGAACIALALAIKGTR